jgi:hypothetical protein
VTTRSVFLLARASPRAGHYKSCAFTGSAIASGCNGSAPLRVPSASAGNAIASPCNSTALRHGLIASASASTAMRRGSTATMRGSVTMRRGLAAMHRNRAFSIKNSNFHLFSDNF